MTCHLYCFFKQKFQLFLLLFTGFIRQIEWRLTGKHMRYSNRGRPLSATQHRVACLSNWAKLAPQKKGDFKRGMAFGVRQTCLSISETAKLLGLSCTTIPRVNRWSENREKNPVSSCSLGQDALLMPEVRGERPGWFQLIEMQHQQEIYASVLTLWWRYIVTTKPSETLLHAHNLTCTSLEASCLLNTDHKYWGWFHWTQTDLSPIKQLWDVVELKIYIMDV